MENDPVPLPSSVPVAAMTLVRGQSVTQVHIEPGENSSEYAATIAHNQGATVVQIVGAVATTASTLTDMLQALPQSALTLKIIAVLGVIAVCAAQLSKALTTMGYSSSRGVVKGGLANGVGQSLNLPPPPAV